MTNLGWRAPKTFKRPGWPRLAGLVVPVLLVTGIAYAILQVQVVVQGNTISTGRADLLVSSDGNTYLPGMMGYDFQDVVPGGDPVPQAGYPIYLKNAGSTTLAVNLAVSYLPPDNNDIDLSKVHIILTAGGTEQSFALQDLLDSSTPGGLPIDQPQSFAPGDTEQFSFQVAMDEDAYSGQGNTLSDLAITFNGKAVN